jgi:hypothetical protein
MKPFCFVALIIFARLAVAQYGVNWPTQPATPMATAVEPGSQVLRISNVNDFLYSYDVNVVEIETATTIPQPPLGGAVGCNTVEINTYSSNAQTALTAYNKLFPASATNVQSLATTQSAWQSNVQPSFSSLVTQSATAHAVYSGITDPAQQSACKGSLDSADTILGTLTTANAKLNQSAHVIVANFTAKACKSALITIIEKYNGVPTGQSISVQLDAECNKFTVSGGVLFSEIQNRTYTSATSPAAAGNFLSVGGTGKFTPTLTSLFNFNFPLEPFGHTVSSSLGDVRLGISTGPVLRLNSSQASSFGWFAGGTLSFYHLLYITPGVHVGEFADFPLGFTASKQPIPAGYGQLNAVTRWTARFGIAITFKGWDVSKTTQGGTDQPKVSK